MSITVTTDVFCDWCSAWMEGAISDRAQAKESRRMVYEEGWRYRWSKARQKYEDVCPRCNKPAMPIMVQQ